MLGLLMGQGTQASQGCSCTWSLRGEAYAVPPQVGRPPCSWMGRVGGLEPPGQREGSGPGHSTLSDWSHRTVERVYQPAAHLGLVPGSYTVPRAQQE